MKKGLKEEEIMRVRESKNKKEEKRAFE